MEVEAAFCVLPSYKSASMDECSAHGFVGAMSEHLTALEGSRELLYLLAFGTRLPKVC